MALGFVLTYVLLRKGGGSRHGRCVSGWIRLVYVVNVYSGGVLGTYGCLALWNVGGAASLFLALSSTGLEITTYLGAGLAILSNINSGALQNIAG